MSKAILLQAAMKTELSQFLHILPPHKSQVVGGYLYHHCQFQGYPIICSETEIGMVNASSASSLALSQYPIACILNQGLAGSHREDLAVGDIVLGAEAVTINSFQKPLQDHISPSDWIPCDFFHPETEEQLSTDSTGSSTAHSIPCSQELLSLFPSSSYGSGNMVQGRLGTGDVWNREKHFIQQLAQTRGSYCEDMESFAVYQIANRWSVPVLGLRIISNNELTNTGYSPCEAEKLQHYILQQLPQVIDWAKQQETISL